MRLVRKPIEFQLRRCFSWQYRSVRMCSSDSSSLHPGGIKLSSIVQSFAHQSDDKISVLFNVPDQPGSLQKALAYFWKYDINMTRIESRPAPRDHSYEFYISFKGHEDDIHIKKLMEDLRYQYTSIQLIGSTEVPWFPRRPADIDDFWSKTLDAGDDLESDHPGFNDKQYRERRALITQAASGLKFGDAIPRWKYTEEEIGTWGQVWKTLVPLLDMHGCTEYRKMLPLLIENCGYRADNIPQLQDVSDFLKSCSGFTIRPVAGLLSARDFFNALAFRVFFSTQYIRHHSKPLYTPEPDIVHELMGHAPMFAIPEFADFSQEIGLASLGASDEQIVKLARCYWYTVEFGLCQENGIRKAVGAGLLSSFGELGYSMGDEPTVLRWDPYDAAERDYPITTYQPLYYCADSLEHLKTSMRSYVNSMPRPFYTRYDSNLQLIEVDRNVKLGKRK